MKPTLLLLHGALNTSVQFSLLSAKLQPYFDVHTLDFSGHSQVPYEGVLNMQVLVGDIARYVEQMESVDILFKLTPYSGHIDPPDDLVVYAA